MKYEEVYLHEYRSPREACQGLEEYFEFYSNRRPHQTLGHRTLAEVYREGKDKGMAADS